MGCRPQALQSLVRQEYLRFYPCRVDCKEAVTLIHNFNAENLLADRGYDTNEIVDFAFSKGMNVVIPPKKNRIKSRNYDAYLYKIRHLVENAFLGLKWLRAVATRYAKSTSAFRGAVVIAAILQWIRLGRPASIRQKARQSRR
jgi:transposase